MKELYILVKQRFSLYPIRLGVCQFWLKVFVGLEFTGLELIGLERKVVLQKSFSLRSRFHFSIQGGS